MGKNNSSKKLRSICIVVFFIAIVVSLVAIIGAASVFYYQVAVDDSSSAWLGAQGDFVGGITNPIFSLLAFLGLLWTIRLQQKELGLSREELRLTREELTRSADAQQDSANTTKEQQQLIQLQQFENTFFSLLSNHNVLLDKIIGKENVSNHESIVDGAITALLVTGGFDEKTSKPVFNFYHYQELISYFIVLYQLLKFVDETPSLSDFDTKKKYTSLLRAYLPNDVLILLMFNCYVDHSKDSKQRHNQFTNYKTLIERYAILEHLPWAGHVGKFATMQELIRPYANRGPLGCHGYYILDYYCYTPCAFGQNISLVEKECSWLVDRYLKEKRIDKLDDETEEQIKSELNPEGILFHMVMERLKVEQNKIFK